LHTRYVFLKVLILKKNWNFPYFTVKKLAFKIFKFIDFSLRYWIFGQYRCHDRPSPLKIVFYRYTRILWFIDDFKSNTSLCILRYCSVHLNNVVHSIPYGRTSCRRNLGWIPIYILNEYLQIILYLLLS